MEELNQDRKKERRSIRERNRMKEKERKRKNNWFCVSNVNPSVKISMSDIQTVYILQYMSGDIIVCSTKVTGFLRHTR